MELIVICENGSSVLCRREKRRMVPEDACVYVKLGNVEKGPMELGSQDGN